MFGTASNKRFTEEAPVVLLAGDAALLDHPLRKGFESLAQDFDRLSDDRWLKTDYVFRQRRFSTFCLDVEARTVDLLANKPFFQTTEINHYAGGIERKFDPLEHHTEGNPFLHQLMWDLYDILPADKAGASQHWEIGVHLMRIIAQSGRPGHPAPEGMHRDGHAFTSITLIRRDDLEGGVSRFARKNGDVYYEATLRHPLDTVIFDDTQGFHDVTSITVKPGVSSGVRDVCGFSLNPI